MFCMVKTNMSHLISSVQPPLDNESDEWGIEEDEWGFGTESTQTP